MVVFIINPDSGGGKGAKVWQAVQKQMKKLHIACEAYMTDEKNDAGALASEISNSACEDIMVIVIGGDRTMSRVLNGLKLSERISLGFISTGFSQDIAKGLKLRTSPLKMLHRILSEEHIRLVDYGIITGADSHHRFLGSAGIGYDAQIAEDRENLSDRSRRNRRHSFILMGISRLFRYKTVHCRLTVNSETRAEFNHFFFASAHITPWEGERFCFAPKADPCDGMLSVCVVHHRQKRKLLRILSASMLGNHLKYAGVRTYSCNEIGIYADVPLPVHADGQFLGRQKDIEFSCIKQKLRFVI